MIMPLCASPIIAALEQSRARHRKRIIGCSEADSDSEIKIIYITLTPKNDATKVTESAKHPTVSSHHKSHQIELSISKRAAVVR